MRLIIFAIRNLGRNKRRSAAILSLVALGSAALLVAGGYAAANFSGLRERTIHNGVGHLQISAFDEQAIDYLLKPVEPERLARALARITAETVPSSAGGDQIERLLQAVERARPSVRRIPVRTGAKVTLVEPAAIIFCRAEDKYAVLYTADGEHIVDRTLDELERSLDPEAFLRVHRSALVNLAFVRDLTSIEGGRFVITLKDATASQVYASRAGARALRDRLGF